MSVSRSGNANSQINIRGKLAWNIVLHEPSLKFARGYVTRGGTTNGDACTGSCTTGTLREGKGKRGGLGGSKLSPLDKGVRLVWTSGCCTTGEDHSPGGIFPNSGRMPVQYVPRSEQRQYSEQGHQSFGKEWTLVPRGWTGAAVCIGNRHYSSGTAEGSPLYLEEKTEQNCV